MTRLADIGNLYAASGSMGVAGGAIGLFAIADSAGERLDRAVRELGREVNLGTVDVLGELFAAVRRLRWRLATEPFPSEHDPSRAELFAGLANLTTRCRLMVGSETRWILDDLLQGATAASGAATPPIGEFLLRSLREDVSGDCVVILSARRAAEGVRSWFRELDIAVPVLVDRERAGLEVHRAAYLIGAPPVFSPAVFGAPRARELAFLFPSWVQDRTLPMTEFSVDAIGSIRPRTRTHKIGDDAFIPDRLRCVEDQLRPEPAWVRPKFRLPVGGDEVHARRVLLCGGLSIMLDLEGDTIRTLDPGRPVGGRVRMRDVEDVDSGTYLVLREGQTESEPLYARALARLAARADAVERSQTEWKSALRERLHVGSAEVTRSLRALGVKAAAQAPAWTARTLARPNSDADFEILLRWLGVPLEPFREHANLVRRARSQAVVDVKEALEAALGDADMRELERVGFLRLDLELEGFAGIVATRVLALSPHLDVVPRSELRIPREDTRARWLE
jgi:hypothetical protein